MGRRQARHLRTRGAHWPVIVLLVVVAVLGTSSSVALLQVARSRARVSMTLLVGGMPRVVRVRKPATVTSVLDAADVVPRPGRLVSLSTRSVLDPALVPVRFLVDGRPAVAGSPVAPGATVGVLEPADVTEEVIQGRDPIAPPPMPGVIHGLWHPGSPGLALTRKGVVSGEVIARTEVQAAVPPAPVTEKLVALTFDDGPWSTTPEVLRVLREKNVKATFCVVTRQLKGPGLAAAKGALGEGHQICNHTVNHDQKLPSKSQKVIEDEIIGANRQLDERLGIKATYYRPPGGSIGPNVIATAKAQGQPVLLWTVDTKDYTRPPPEAIVASVMGQVQPGGVVLMHDGGGDRANTLTALPAMIDQLRGAGYELVLPDSVAPVPAAPVTSAALPA